MQFSLLADAFIFKYCLHDILLISLNVSPSNNPMTVFVATKKQGKFLNVLFVSAVDTVFDKEERLYIFAYSVVRA
jgi:hypothetical protein